MTRHFIAAPAMNRTGRLQGGLTVYLHRFQFESERKAGRNRHAFLAERARHVYADGRYPCPLRLPGSQREYEEFPGIVVVDTAWR